MILFKINFSKPIQTVLGFLKGKLIKLNRFLQLNLQKISELIYFALKIITKK